MCVLSIKVPIRKKFGNLSYAPRIHMIWFGWVLWHISHCRLFNAKSSLYIYIRYILFVNTFCGKYFKMILGSFLCTLLYNCHNQTSVICLLIWFADIFILKCIRFGLVWSYSILTIAGYVMPNPPYSYILSIYDLWVNSL